MYIMQTNAAVRIHATALPHISDGTNHSFKYANLCECFDDIHKKYVRYAPFTEEGIMFQRFYALWQVTLMDEAMKRLAH